MAIGRIIQKIRCRTPCNRSFSYAMSTPSGDLRLIEIFIFLYFFEACSNNCFKFFPFKTGLLPRISQIIGRKTRQFPSLSPETPFNDLGNTRFVDQYFPGVNQFPTMSLSDFPSVSPKTGLVDFLSSKTHFPSVSPGIFPIYVTFGFPSL